MPALSVAEIPASDTAAWLPFALCRGLPLVWWFPKGGDAGRRGKRVCAVCPVTEQCREWATVERIGSGTWGGSSPSERRAAWKARARSRSARGVPPDLAAVPQRMRDVVRMTRSGMSGKEVAQDLGVTERTVSRIRTRARGLGLLPPTRHV